MSRTSSRWAVVALFAIGMGGCYALRSTSPCEVDTDCDRGTVCSSDGSYCRTGGPIAVGVLVPATGNQSTTAPARLDGIRFGQWIVERSPDRRVLGRGLQFLVDDTLSTPEEAGRAAARLVRRNIAALIGPGASAEVLEAQRITFAERILHIAPSAGASAVGDAQGPLAERYLFQLSTEVSRGSIRAIPLFLARSDRPPAYDACFDGMAVVVADDVTGNSYEQGLSRILPTNCVPITRMVRTSASKKADYASEVDELQSARNGSVKTRCVLLAVRPDVAGELLRTLKSRERTSAEPPYSAFLGASLLNAPGFFEEAKSPVVGQPSLAEGFHGVDNDSAPERATARDLRDLFEAYKAEHPELPADLELGADRANWSEAVILVSLAIELAGTVEPVAVRDALIDLAQPGEGDLVIGPKQLDIAFARIRAARADGRRAALDYRGAQSNYDFGERGFVDLPAQIWRATGGSIQEHWTGFDEEQLATVTQDPGPACARKPR